VSGREAMCEAKGEQGDRTAKQSLPLSIHRGAWKGNSANFA
jgi:hypothetical protein